MITFHYFTSPTSSWSQSPAVVASVVETTPNGLPPPIHASFFGTNSVPDRAPGAFWQFRTVPSAPAFFAQQAVLRVSYVENLTFRQTGVGDIPSYVWKNLGKSMSTAVIQQWTIDGLRLEAVVRFGFGSIRVPFDATKELRSVTARNCPYLRIQ